MAHEATARGFIDALNRLEAGPHVALAVSGGGDSMGMLALAALARKLDDAPRFSVLTVDHGLRPEAAAEAQQVASACQRLGLPHVTLTADRELAPTDIQQQARHLRYRLMGAWCAAKGACLAVAHHREDQAETVLMRLARGSGIDGLSAMAAQQTLNMPDGPLRLVRPFLKLSSTALYDLAASANLPIINDPSNGDTQYERVRWRQVMPQLSEMGLDAARLAGLAETMRATRETLNRRLHVWLTEHGDWHDYGVLCLSRAAFLDLPDGYQARLLSGYIQHFGGLRHPKKRRQIERLCDAVKRRAHGAETLGGVAMRWRRRSLFLGREAAACPTIMPTGEQIIWDRRYELVSRRFAGLKIRPLGQLGVQTLRDRGFTFDAQVPSAYYQALPGVWSKEYFVSCPLFDRSSWVKAYNIGDAGFARDTLGAV